MRHRDTSGKAARFATRVIAIAVLLLAGLAASVAPAVAERILHVDFEGGDDSRDGSTPTTARKTAPPAAMIRPGTRILFKGGVRYPLPINVPAGADGTAEAPVIYDGNSRGEWGEGPAILDGSRRLGPWTPAGRTDEGLVIWETEAPEQIERHQLVIFQDERRARLASSADLDDNWILPQWERYFQVPRARARDGALTDPERLLPLSDAWDEASILVHHGNNHLDPFAVSRFERDTGTVHFPGAKLLREGDVRYAVLNHPDVLDAPGEFLVRGGRLQYIPMDGRDPNEADVRFAFWEIGFLNQAAGHVTVQGFHILMHRRFGVLFGHARQPVWREGNRAIGNVIENGGQIAMFYQKDFAVAGNRMRDILETRPIHMVHADAGRVEDNHLRRTESGITAFTTTNSLFKNNDVRDILGVHGNAMTIYEASHNARIIGNRLVGDRGITLRDSDNQLIAFNRISGNMAIAQWAPLQPGLRYTIVNNTLAGSVLLLPETTATTTFVNNAVNVLNMLEPEAFVTRTHNLYGFFRRWRTVQRENLREGETFLPFGHAFDSVDPSRMVPTPMGRERLSGGLPISIAGVEVSHMGAVGMSGEMPDLSGIGLPPHDPAVAP